MYASLRYQSRDALKVACRLSEAVLVICFLQWHVTPSALKQWIKYKTMINEDAAKHQRQLQQQQQRQQNSNESAGNQSHSSADATVVIRQHAGEPCGTKRPAASNSADHSQYAEPKTKRQHLGVESSGSDAEQNTAQLPQPSIENLSSSSIPQAEDVSDVNDTVGAIFVDAAGCFLAHKRNPQMHRKNTCC